MRPILVFLLLLLPLSAALACGDQGPDGLFEGGFERCAPRAQSVFRALPEDRTLAPDSSAFLIDQPLWLDRPAEVIVVADGRLFPLGNPHGRLEIAIDGSVADSSAAEMDWTDSRRPVQHGFRVLAHARLGKGGHRIALVAHNLSASIHELVVGGGTGLAVLVEPSGAVTSSALIGDSIAIDVMTYRPALGIDVNEGDADRPLVPMLGHILENPGKLPLGAASLGAGTARHACNSSGDGGYGDVLWGLRADGVCPSTADAGWAVNDIDPGAELGAPVAMHGFHGLAAGASRHLELVASELAFGSDQSNSKSGSHENDVCYQGADARLISVVGSAVSGMGDTISDRFCSTYTWRCVASTEDIDGCPRAARRVAIGRATVTIPPDHDGTVFFSAATRVQGSNEDGFTTIRLWIEIDGLRVGTGGVQQLAAGVGEASRTLTAAHLAAGAQRLAPGEHEVRVMLRVDGDKVKHLAIPSDQPLVWFD